jgi:uncharacterized membrane protein
MSSSNARPESKRRPSKLRNVLVVALVAAYPVVAWWAFEYGGRIGASALWVGALPQVFCYLGLLWLFGRSLRGSREALVTRIARFVHGELSAEKKRYTRQVTVFWCVFFATMAIVSISMLLFVSIDAWLFFANVLNLPILACAFLAEYTYRLVRHPNFAGESLTAPIRAYRRYRESDRSD